MDRLLVFSLMLMPLFGLLSCGPIYHDAMPCGGRDYFEQDSKTRWDRKHSGTVWVTFEQPENPAEFHFQTTVVLQPFFGPDYELFNWEYRQVLDHRFKDGSTTATIEIDRRHPRSRKKELTAFILELHNFRMVEPIRSDTIFIDEKVMTRYGRSQEITLGIHNTCYEKPRKILFSRYRKHYVID